MSRCLLVVVLSGGFLSAGGSSLLCETVNWQDVFAGVWKHSYEAQRVQAELDTAGLALQVAENSHLPRVGLDAPGLMSWNRTGGLNVPVQGREAATDPQDLLGAGAGVGVRQVLPGEGLWQAKVSHRVEVDVTKEAYRQSPGLQISASQPLGPGFLSWDTDPVWRLAMNERTRAVSTYGKAQVDVFRSWFDVMRRWYLAQRDMEVRGALREAARLRKDFNDRLLADGNLAESAKWKSDRALSSAEVEKTKADLTEAEARIEWVRGMGAQPPAMTSADLEVLLATMSSGARPRTDPEVELLEAEADALSWNRLRELIGHAPSLTLDLSVGLDPASHGYFSQWKDSWDDLQKSPSRWTVSATVGLTIPVDYSGETDLLEKTSAAKASQKALEVAEIAEKHRLQRDAWQSKAEAYDQTQRRLRIEVKKGRELLADSRTLAARGVLTLADVWDLQAELLRLEADRDSVLWEAIQARLEIHGLQGQPFLLVQ